MPRELIACPVQDLSSFAKSLRAQLLEQFRTYGDAPSHLSLMNMLARAAGHRNLQALIAARPTLPAPAGRAPSELSETALRALRQFDEHGRLLRWPTKFSVQRHALWGLWMHFDAKRPYSEREVNQILQARHCFGDHCTLRRELVTMKLLTRTSDGRCYRKMAARPDADVAALLRTLRSRGNNT